MHDDPTAPTERNVYYYGAYVRVEASSQEEAWCRLQDEPTYLCDADIADGPSDAVQLVVTDLLESVPVEAGPECICPPDLVARGGFKGQCPVHGRPLLSEDRSEIKLIPAEARDALDPTAPPPVTPERRRAAEDAVKRYRERRDD